MHLDAKAETLFEQSSQNDHLPSWENVQVSFNLNKAPVIQLDTYMHDSDRKKTLAFVRKIALAQKNIDVDMNLHDAFSISQNTCTCIFSETVWQCFEKQLKFLSPDKTIVSFQCVMDSKTQNINVTTIYIHKDDEDVNNVIKNCGTKFIVPSKCWFSGNMVKNKFIHSVRRELLEQSFLSSVDFQNVMLVMTENGPIGIGHSFTHESLWKNHTVVSLVSPYLPT